MILSANAKQSVDGFGIALMLFLTLVWGMNIVVGKIAIRGLDPIFLSFLRAVIAAAALYLWCLYRKIPIFAKDDSLASGVIVGFLFGIEFLLIYIGLELTSASRASLMINTMPLFTLIGAHYFLGERATLTKIIGTFLSFIGVIIVFFDQLSLPSPDAIYGDMLCIVAGASWAATALVIRRTNVGKVAPEKLLLYQLAGAAFVAASFLPFSPDLVRQMDWVIVVSVLFQALFVVAFTYSLWFWAVLRYPVAGLAAFTFLTPVFGVLIGWLILGEPMSVGLIGGLVLVICGLMLVNRSDGLKNHDT
jgi:drug/metabolite transporter (DMT)-like permease